MPANVVQAYARKTGVSIKKAEERWSKARAAAEKAGRSEEDGDRYWAYVTGVFKRMMGIKEDIFVERRDGMEILGLLLEVGSDHAVEVLRELVTIHHLGAGISGSLGSSRCPYCGASVMMGDEVCKTCGRSLMPVQAESTNFLAGVQTNLGKSLLTRDQFSRSPVADYTKMIDLHHSNKYKVNRMVVRNDGDKMEVALCCKDTNERDYYYPAMAIMNPRSQMQLGLLNSFLKSAGFSYHDFRQKGQYILRKGKGNIKKTVTM
jgi:hypothetical protein